MCSLLRQPDVSERLPNLNLLLRDWEVEVGSVNPSSRQAESSCQSASYKTGQKRHVILILQARSGGHMKVVDYMEAAMAKLADPTELADKDGAAPRAPHVAASEKRIKQRLERLASLKQEVR
jgi:hypothetical protein